MNILITGVAGFIGYNLCNKISDNIIGVDNLNDYYDVNLKKDRLKKLQEKNNFSFFECDISKKEELEKIFLNNKIDLVINLAAQAGVRYSLENPDAYINSNIIGFYNILECCKKYNIKKLIFASSSSVYGDNQKYPFEINDDTNHPVSLYAATKKSNELLAYSYSKLYNISCVGLRFFSVYGPFGRPDMAYFDFTKKLINNEKIKVFNYGLCERDFTYINDVVESISKIINSDFKDYKIYNIGNENPIKMINFINILTNELIKQKLLPIDFNIENNVELLPLQPGDVIKTYADIKDFYNDYGYKPNTSIEKGIEEFVKWYKEYYKEEEK